VLKFNPELVFVEFAVNEGGAPAEKIIRSQATNPETNIEFTK